jgi:ubiquinone/menaquinone biosynthesis C-methylase UbiE
METPNPDSVFAGSIPEIYDEFLVPLIFEFYATDLAARAAETPGTALLELAAGTGVCTRALAQTLPEGVFITATDLNQAMLDRAASRGAARIVHWRQADAMSLPFPPASFDTVVCQFGVMFLPDRAAAFAEARRVLRPHGRFIFSVWDRLDENDFAAETTAALTRVFPERPPRFLNRVPHGYNEKDVIRRDLRLGGFTRDLRIDTLAGRSRAKSPRIPAVAYCQGTPLRTEIETHGSRALAEATLQVERSIAARFGSGAVDGKMQAHIVAAMK